MKKLCTTFSMLFVLICIWSSAFALSEKNVSQIHKYREALTGTNMQQEELSSFDNQSIFTVPSKKINAVLKAKSLVATFDSIYYWSWDTLTNRWAVDPYSKAIDMVYDASGNETGETDQSRDTTTSAWVNAMQRIYTFDANNNKTSLINLIWDTTTTAWSNYYKVDYTYDNHNNLISALAYGPDGNTWIALTQYLYTYDANNNETHSLCQKMRGIWVNYSQSTRTYDANNNLTSELNQIWKGTAWVNSSWCTYSSNGNNKILDFIQQSWVNNAWVNCYHFTNTYDLNNNQTSQLQQNWKNSAWVNSSLYTYTYDVNKNITGCIEQYWNGTVWVKNYQDNNTFYDNNLYKSVIETYWNDAGTEVLNGDSTYYYLHTCSKPVQPGPVAGNPTVCAGTSNTYSITAVPGATNYTWKLPNGWTGTSTGNSITAIAGALGGTISVMAKNECDSSAVQTLSVTVNTAPATPGSVSGNSVVCSGSSNTYSIAAVNGATSYTWTLPVGWTGTSTTNSITATAGIAGGNITVTANNACNSSAAKIVSVTVNTAPATPGSVSGNSVVCSGSSNTYSIAAVNGATSYTWTLPVGWTGTSTTNSINATAGTAGGNVSVTANNVCNSSAAQTLSIIVNEIPATPVITLNNGILQSNASNGNQWYLSNNLIPDATNVTYIPSLAGNYSVLVTLNGCSSQPSNVILFNPAGINETADHNEIRVCPNPASDKIQLISNQYSLSSIEIYNLLGGKIFSYQAENQSSGKAGNRSSFAINLNETPDGVYFVKVKTEKGVEVLKFVKR